MELLEEISLFLYIHSPPLSYTLSQNNTILPVLESFLKILSLEKQQHWSFFSNH